MKRSASQSPQAVTALDLLEKLQTRFVSQLSSIAKSHKEDSPFSAVEWLRDKGLHGGGVRYMAPTGKVFNRGSVNLSQVHYDQVPEKKLASATALSTIIHPHEPYAPSVHIHISWTEFKAADGYWRIMADLNPSLTPCPYQETFHTALTTLAGKLATEGLQQGDKYFFIPALNRHRGVCHFYLESYRSDDQAQDLALASSFGKGIIDRYCEILDSALDTDVPTTPQQRQQQLAYHSLYFYQVLTLDRGTSSGLLVHDQNDVGTLGSIPSHVDRPLLESWVPLTPPPQSELLTNLIACLPAGPKAHVDDDVKKKLAATLREHYRSHPQALDMQARGDKIPPTVSNHL